jgi:hypothetical protein
MIDSGLHVYESAAGVMLISVKVPGDCISRIDLLAWPQLTVYKQTSYTRYIASSQVEEESPVLCQGCGAKACGCGWSASILCTTGPLQTVSIRDRRRAKGRAVVALALEL